MANDSPWGNFKLPDFSMEDDSNATGGFKVPDIQWPDASGMSTTALKSNAGTPSDWSTKWFGGVDGKTGTASPGIIPTGINAFSGLASAYLGFQQMNLAKQQLSQSKKIFNLNFMNQAANVNRDLEDRQRARVASNSSAYQSVDEYMNKNKVNGKGL